MDKIENVIVKCEYPIYKGMLYNCIYCHTNFISLDFLQKHQHKCQFLKIHSLLKQKLNTLAKRKREEKTPKPVLTYQQTKKREYHRKNETEEDRNKNSDFYCNVCFKGFVTFSRYNWHMRVHSDERPFKCDICPKTFKWRSGLSQHQSAHNKGKQYQCEICMKSFTQKQNLLTHIGIHSGEKPFECPYCPMKFLNKSNLIRHLKCIHLKEQPKYCCTLCPSEFNSKSNLDQHLRAHSNKKPFECPICPKKFNFKGNLTQHLRIHTRNVEDVS